jgi:ComF family protein
LNKLTGKDIVLDFVGLFFPRYCRGCDGPLVRSEELICMKCMLDLPRSNYHLEKENPFYKKLRGRIPVEHVMAFFKFVKSGKVQKLLHALKYKNQPEVGVALGRLYAQYLVLADYETMFDLILPVPLHTLKKRQRGYNQSEEFGKGLSETLGIECSDTVLERRSQTATQTKKSKVNRWTNVNEVFGLKKPELVIGKRILLVDDVVTTGATVEACGQVLLDGGCSQLSIACIAATQ